MMFVNALASGAGRACFLVAGICLLIAAPLRADDIPPRPAEYFHDEAHVVDPGTAAGFNAQLENFERQTSNQIVVAVYPKMQSDDAVASYTYRVAQAWGVGQNKLNNGAVLFVFVQDHKAFIQTGYGLEGSLPDVTCERIVEDEMAPHFKQGDYAGGLRAAINAMIAATKGEYKGNGGTHADSAHGSNVMLLIVITLFVVFSLFRRTRGMMYDGASGIGR